MPIFFYASHTGFTAYRPDALQAESIQDILTNPVKYISLIPPQDRYNIYFATAHTKSPRQKSDEWADKDWIKRDVLNFDIDKIKDEKDLKKAEKYSEVIAKVIGCQPQEMSIVMSGHGFHFHLFQAGPITNWRDCETKKPLYNFLCDKIDQALKEAGLGGECDRVIFDRARLLRLPGTENRKKDLPVAHCELIQLSLYKHSFTLHGLLGFDDVAQAHQLNSGQTKQILRSYDREAILSGCEVIQWAEKNPTEVHYPEGYALLSILGRLDDDKALAKKRMATWTGSPSLLSKDPDSQIEAALHASGPRTCEGMALVSGTTANLCQACKYYKKVKTPLHIQSPEFIATETSGFYTVVSEKGKTVRVPCYEDLLKAYIRDHHYFVSSETEEVWSYLGTHYVRTPRIRIKAWAENQMKPKPLDHIRNEFYSKVMANQVKDADEFKPLFERTVGKLNLMNGVLDTRTLDLEPHTHELGFKYVVPYSYEPGARCPQFLTFLHTIMEGDTDRILSLQAMFGYSLATGYEGLEAAFWVLVGGGFNGKSKLLDIKEGMLGGQRNSVHLKPKNFRDADRFALSGLDGKLLCVIEEVNEKFVADDFLGMIKDLSSGGTVTVEGKGIDPWQMKNTAKFVMTTNKDLVLEDTSQGLKRRLIPIVFNVNFEDPAWEGKTNPKIADEIIVAELPGVLNWALAGLRAVWDRGGKPYVPGSSRDKLRQMILASDSVERWAHDHLTVTNDETDFISSTELYSLYKHSEVTDHPVSSTVFGTRVRKKTNEHCRSKVLKKMPDKKVIRGFFGVKIKELTEDDTKY